MGKRGVWPGHSCSCGKQIGILSDRGELVIADANHYKFQELAKFQVLSGKENWTPHLCNGRMHCRSSQGKWVCLKMGDESTVIRNESRLISASSPRNSSLSDSERMDSVSSSSRTATCLASRTRSFLGGTKHEFFSAVRKIGSSLNQPHSFHSRH